MSDPKTRDDYGNRFVHYFNMKSTAWLGVHAINAYSPCLKNIKTKLTPFVLLILTLMPKPFPRYTTI